MDELRQRYEDNAYSAVPIVYTHPGHLAAYSRLHGLTPKGNPDATVLEIGCADATNLRSIATSMPNARLLGIDLSPTQIAHGTEAARRQGHTNIELIPADLAAHDLAGERFDYIIAHGVLSWVPNHIKTRIFEVCRDHLTPHGVGFISYNTYPGWASHLSLIELLKLEGAHQAADAPSLHRHVHTTLDRLDTALKDQPGSHVAQLQRNMEIIRAHDPSTLFHDEFEPVNDPCYFLQFAQWAREHDLAYVCDAQLSTTWPNAMAEPLRTTLEARGGGRLSNEQYADFVTNRRFRMSIVCNAQAEPQDDIDPLAARGLMVNAKVKPISSSVAEERNLLAFETEGGRSFGVLPGVQENALRHLSKNQDRFVDWQELLQAATANSNAPDPESDLAAFVLELAALDVASISTINRPVPLLEP